MQADNESHAAITLDDLPYLISRYEIDPTHASAQFKVRHLMVASVRGELGEVNGIVMIDETDITQSSVTATIDLTAISTRNPQRDEHLRSADFLDVENFPTLTFRSTRVEEASRGRLLVIGDLTIRGKTNEIGLMVELTDEIRFGGVVKRGASASTRINRKDFGVSWNAVMDAGGVVVSDTVEITIELELVRKAL
jgi:polyisoprenoid-binding protein YceI